MANSTKALSTAGIVIGALICFGLAYRYSVQSVADERLKALNREAEQANAVWSIVKIAHAHNAVTDWSTQLGREGSGVTPYSAELETVFVRSDGRPLLFLATVLDLKRKGSGYTCEFDTWDVKDLTIHLSLDCDEPQALNLQQRREPSRDLFFVAVVAEPHSIQKQGSSTYQARGRCLDLLFYGPFPLRYAEIAAAERASPP